MKHLLRFCSLFLGLFFLGTSVMQAEEEPFVINISARPGMMAYAVDFGAFQAVPENNVITLEAKPQYNVAFLPLSGYEIFSYSVGLPYSFQGKNGFMVDVSQLSNGCTLVVDVNKEGEAPTPPTPPAAEDTVFVVNFDVQPNTLYYSLDYGDLVVLPEDNKVTAKEKPFGLEIYPRSGYKITSCSAGRPNTFGILDGYAFLPEQLTNGMTITVGVEQESTPDFVIYLKAESKTLYYSVDGGELKDVPDDNQLMLSGAPEKTLAFFPKEGYYIEKCSMGELYEEKDMKGYIIDAKDLSSGCEIDIEVLPEGEQKTPLTINLVAPEDMLAYVINNGEFVPVPKDNVISLEDTPAVNFGIFPLKGFEITSCSMGAPAELAGVNGYILEPKELTDGMIITVEAQAVQIGIKEITADSKVTFYDLQGRCVTDPRHGNFYIVKQGDKVSKVVL